MFNRLDNYAHPSINSLYVIDPNSGEKELKFSGLGIGEFFLIDTAGTFYINQQYIDWWNYGQNRGYIRAIDSQGNIKWIISSFCVPKMGDAIGTIYCTLGLRDIVAFNSDNGSVKWSWNSGDNICIYSSPSPYALGMDKTIYVPTYSGIYAIGSSIPENQPLASIDEYFPNDPSNPINVEVGNSIPISVTFTNTGNVAWTFVAGASIWDSTENLVGIYEKTLDIALQPGQQATVNWVHVVN